MRLFFPAATRQREIKQSFDTEIRLGGVEKRIRSTTRAISLCVRLDSGSFPVGFCRATSRSIWFVAFHASRRLRREK
ncbi:hypothetical protein FOXYSP1_08302 [Fusarium oxysporum f. sp. phaseoli]